MSSQKSIGNNGKKVSGRENIFDVIPRKQVDALTSYNGVDLSYYKGLSTNYHRMLETQNMMVDKDAHIDATMKVLYTAVGQMKYTLNSQCMRTHNGKQIYQFVERLIYKDLQDFDKFIRQLCLSFKDGTTFCEILYKKTFDGYISVKDILVWDPKHFMFDTDGCVVFSPDQSFLGSKNNRYHVPELKILVHRNNAEYGSYYGKSELGASIWYLYNIKKDAGLKSWIVLVSRHGVPTPVCTVPKDMPDDDKKALLAMLTEFNEDQALVLTEGISTEFAESGISIDSDTHIKLVMYCDKAISKKILGQTLMMENDGIGSYAATKVHQQVNQQIINAKCRELQNTINKFIKRLVDLNFDNVHYSEYPYIEFYIREDDLEKQMDLYKMCKELNIPFSLSEFYKKFEITQPNNAEDNALMD